MVRARISYLLMALVCMFGLCMPAQAVQVDCDAVYCFTPADFSQEEEPLLGICITGLPDASAGTVLLGNRVLRKGDILTDTQLEQLTFRPLRTEADEAATLCYLPIYENRVAPAATMSIAIRGKTDAPPVATDSAMETYRNLPNTGRLQAHDPEGQALQYTLMRSPRRGQVVLQEDGTFLYTPKHNKVGVDSFTYTATDPAGNVSREATVTVEILKPADKSCYADTVGLDCRFEAEWLRNTGLFAGEQIGQQLHFSPDKHVSCGEFLAIAVKALDIPVDDTWVWAADPDAPDWLKPYLAAALRSGLTAGWEQTDYAAPITGAQAAVMLQNALDLTADTPVQAEAEQEDVPVWAADALETLRQNGVELTHDSALTRADMARILYQARMLAANAPGAAVLRLQA